MLERIGSGAFGEVYRAWDTRLDREVALKLLPADAGASDVAHSSIIEEGRLLARVRHPNVVTIYGAERIGGRVGLWMEFVKGRTLEQALRDGRRFTAAEVTRLGVELCRAVVGRARRRPAASRHQGAERHARRRRPPGADGLRHRTRAGRCDGDGVAGTPLYLAPEVLAGEGRHAAERRLQHRRAAVSSVDEHRIRCPAAIWRISGGLTPLAAMPALASIVLRSRSGFGASSRARSILIRVGAMTSAERWRCASPRWRAPTRRRAVIAAACPRIVAAVAGSWNSGCASRQACTAGVRALATTPAIAVLPFKNLSSDPDSDYFVDGLTSEVIRNLAVIDGLEVRSQTSSFYFKDRPRDLRDVGRAARRRPGRRGHRPAGRQPAAHQRAARARLPTTCPVVRAIRSQARRRVRDSGRDLSCDRQQAAADPRTRASGATVPNSATYDLYLRGRARGRRGLRAPGEAAQLFEQVIAQDPAFAPAHAGLADAYANMAWSDRRPCPCRGPRRHAACRVRALQLDPPARRGPRRHGHRVCARAGLGQGQRVIRAGRSNWTRTSAGIRTSYSFSTLVPWGTRRKPWTFCTIASPHRPAVARGETGSGNRVVHRRAVQEEAVTILRQVIAADPDFTYAANLLARSLTFAGRPEEAIAFWESRPEHRPWEHR